MFCRATFSYFFLSIYFLQSIAIILKLLCGEQVVFFRHVQHFPVVIISFKITTKSFLISFTRISNSPTFLIILSILIFQEPPDTYDKLLFHNTFLRFRSKRLFCLGLWLHVQLCQNRRTGQELFPP